VLREVTAPPYTQLDPTPYLINIEYGGQIIKQSVFNRSATLGVSIQKVGNQQVLAGDSMRYDFTVSNDSNVPLDSFSWRDQIPVDGARAAYLTTGTYSARQYYSVHYRTNYNDYRELGKDLLTTVNQSFDLSSIPLMSGEVITDIKLEFGTAPAGFTSVVKPTITVSVLPGLNNGYQLVNRAYIAGKYMSQWEYNHSSWITTVVNLKQNKPLPKTGY
jgi:conserved repeat domain